MKLDQYYSILAISVTLCFVLLYICFPALRVNFYEEDLFLENLTAIFYFIGLVLAVFFLFKKKHFAKLYLLVPLASLVCFLDEIGFGERIFGYTIYLGDYNADGIHDIFGFSKYLARSFLAFMRSNMLESYHEILVLFLKISLLGIFFYLTFVTIKNIRLISSKVSDIIDRYPPFKFILFAIIFGMISILLDEILLDRVPLGNPGILLEELSEMNASLSLIFASLSLQHWAARHPQSNVALE